MEVLSETPVSMAQLKEELARIKERDKELNFRAEKTEEYLNHFVSNKDQKPLIEKLEKLNIPRLKNVHIAKIADIMPRTMNELKLILQYYVLTVSAENMKKIVDTVASFKGNK